MHDATEADAWGRWWIRVGMVNVSSMVKRSGEVSDMLCRRKVDVCGLQEVRFNNEGVKFLQGGPKTRYKMFWNGGKEGQNGVGIAVLEEWVGSVVRVMRASERLMVVKLILDGKLVTFVSVYSPEVSQPQEEDEFYKLHRFMGKLKGKYVVVGDLNRHVGSNVDVYEGVHDGNGLGDHTAEGEAILELPPPLALLLRTHFSQQRCKSW